eukprot:Pompholyxophrys_punicea_v1_NODE_21_length_5692_cov_19.735675.p6 type:complete len:112 gc:universal NODE_21_length_5692_cov_19.735675:1437-1102(-)
MRPLDPAIFAFSVSPSPLSPRSVLVSGGGLPTSMVHSAVWLIVLLCGCPSAEVHSRHCEERLALLPLVWRIGFPGWGGKGGVFASGKVLGLGTFPFFFFLSRDLSTVSCNM